MGFKPCSIYGRMSVLTLAAVLLLTAVFSPTAMANELEYYAAARFGPAAAQAFNEQDDGVFCEIVDSSPPPGPSADPTVQSAAHDPGALPARPAGQDAAPPQGTSLDEDQSTAGEGERPEGDGGPVAEVWVNSSVVFRLRAEMGGLSLAERCSAVVERLETLLTDEPELTEDIQPDTEGDKAVVAAGDLLLATVSQVAAEANDTQPEVVAWVWANQLREALGLEVLDQSEIPSFPEPEPDPFADVETVAWVASWYGDRFKGRRTASGETFDPGLLTAAHPSLPFGTLLRVTDPASGQQVVVRVNDRGPFIKGRHLDLSEAAAREVGLISKGVGTVWVEVLPSV